MLPEKVKNAANVTSSPQSTPSSARRSSTSSAAVPTLCTIRSAKGGVFSSIAGTVPRV